MSARWSRRCWREAQQPGTATMARKVTSGNAALPACHASVGSGAHRYFRASNGVVRGNSGASLVDLGDGIACIELHSKKSAIGDDIMRLITKTLEPASDSVRDFRGFVISTTLTTSLSAQT